MLDLNVMRVFVQVAEARSFTVAGRRLGLTPSAVSKAVLRLETEYGVRLLNRTTRSVGLTHEGTEFYERCRQALGDIEEAETLLTQATGRPRGSLRVQAPVAFGRKVVLPALARALVDVPELHVDVELGDRIVDPVDEGLDAMIRFGDLPDSSLIAHKLCDVAFVACASPAYLERRGVPRTPADLHAHTCLGYTTSRTRHYREWRFRDDAGQTTLHSISGQLNVNSAESLIDAALAGAGIAMVGDFTAQEALHSGALRLVLRPYLAPPVPVSVLYLPARKRSPRLRWFLDVLREAVPRATRLPA